MFVSVTFIAMLMTPIAHFLTSLICANKNNGDKFYLRKSRRAVNEKLMINELGPKSHFIETLEETCSGVIQAPAPSTTLLCMHCQ